MHGFARRCLRLPLRSFCASPNSRVCHRLLKCALCLPACAPVCFSVATASRVAAFSRLCCPVHARAPRGQTVWRTGGVGTAPCPLSSLLSAPPDPMHLVFWRPHPPPPPVFPPRLVRPPPARPPLPVAPCVVCAATETDGFAHVCPRPTLAITPCKGRLPHVSLRLLQRQRRVFLHPRVALFHRRTARGAVRVRQHGRSCSRGRGRGRWCMWGVNHPQPPHRRHVSVPRAQHVWRRGGPAVRAIVAVHGVRGETHGGRWWRGARLGRRLCPGRLPFPAAHAGHTDGGAPRRRLRRRRHATLCADLGPRGVPRPHPRIRPRHRVVPGAVPRARACGAHAGGGAAAGHRAAVSRQQRDAVRAQHRAGGPGGAGAQRGAAAGQHPGPRPLLRRAEEQRVWARHRAGVAGHLPPRGHARRGGQLGDCGDPLRRRHQAHSAGAVRQPGGGGGGGPQRGGNGGVAGGRQPVLCGGRGAGPHHQRAPVCKHWREPHELQHAVRHGGALARQVH